MRRKLLLAACLTIVVFAAIGCGGGYRAPKPAATTSPSQGVEGEVAVTATYGRFQPSAISLKKGQVIQLRVTATDTNHTFTIEELGINIAISKGQTTTKETRMDKVGTFTFYCTVPGHRGAGMQGTLKVTE